MPHGAPNSHGGALLTPRVRNGEPQPAPSAAAAASEPASTKRDLASWWKQFSKRNMKKEEEKGTVVHSCRRWLHVLVSPRPAHTRSAASSFLLLLLSLSLSLSLSLLLSLSSSSSSLLLLSLLSLSLSSSASSSSPCQVAASHPGGMRKLELGQPHVAACDSRYMPCRC